MVSREFLLQFTDQTGLDFLELLQLRNRHEDDNGLFALADLDFLGSSDVQFPQLTFEI